MKKSKYDLWIGALNLINCVLFISSWFAILGADFTARIALIFYLFAWFGVILNAVAVVQSHNMNISPIGPILGVIGNALYGFTAALALPAVIVNIMPSLSLCNIAIKNRKSSQKLAAFSMLKFVMYWLTITKVGFTMTGR